MKYNVIFKIIFVLIIILSGSLVYANEIGVFSEVKESVDDNVRLIAIQETSLSDNDIIDYQMYKEINDDKENYRVHILTYFGEYSILIDGDTLDVMGVDLALFVDENSMLDNKSVLALAIYKTGLADDEILDTDISFTRCNNEPIWDVIIYTEAGKYNLKIDSIRGEVISYNILNNDEISVQYDQSSDEIVYELAVYTFGLRDEDILVKIIELKKDEEKYYYDIYLITLDKEYNIKINPLSQEIISQSINGLNSNYSEIIVE